MDPTTTTYVPRPEWYFFFLFELLRVLKPPELVPVATVGIPTVAMVLLIFPFIDRGPERRPERRPIATTVGILTIVSMGYLTFLGAQAGIADRDRAHRRPGVRGGQGGRRAVRVPACHLFEHNGNPGPGPDLTHIGEKLPREAIARSLEVGPGIMPSYADLPPAKKQDLIDFLASLR